MRRARDDDDGMEPLWDDDRDAQGRLPLSDMWRQCSDAETLDEAIQEVQAACTSLLESMVGAAVQVTWSDKPSMAATSGGGYLVTLTYAPLIGETLPLSGHAIDRVAAYALHEAGHASLRVGASDGRLSGQRVAPGATAYGEGAHPMVSNVVEDIAIDRGAFQGVHAQEYIRRERMRLAEEQQEVVAAETDPKMRAFYAWTYEELYHGIAAEGAMPALRTLATEIRHCSDAYALLSFACVATDLLGLNADDDDKEKEGSDGAGEGDGAGGAVSDTALRDAARRRDSVLRDLARRLAEEKAGDSTEEAAGAAQQGAGSCLGGAKPSGIGDGTAGESDIIQHGKGGDGGAKQAATHDVLTTRQVEEAIERVRKVNAARAALEEQLRPADIPSPILARTLQRHLRQEPDTIRYTDHGRLDDRAVLRSALGNGNVYALDEDDAEVGGTVLVTIDASGSVAGHWRPLFVPTFHMIAATTRMFPSLETHVLSYYWGRTGPILTWLVQDGKLLSDGQSDGDNADQWAFRYVRLECPQLGAGKRMKLLINITDNAPTRRHPSSSIDWPSRISPGRYATHQYAQVANEVVALEDAGWLVVGLVVGHGPQLHAHEVRIEQYEDVPGQLAAIIADAAKAPRMR